MPLAKLINDWLEAIWSGSGAIDPTPVIRNHEQTTRTDTHFSEQRSAWSRRSNSVTHFATYTLSRIFLNVWERKKRKLKLSYPIYHRLVVPVGFVQGTVHVPFFLRQPHQLDHEFLVSYLHRTDFAASRSTSHRDARTTRITIVPWSPLWRTCQERRSRSIYN